MEDFDLNNIIILIFSICLISIGYTIYFDPIITRSSLGIIINVGEYHKYIGAVIAIVGCYFLWVLFKVNNKS